MLWYCKAAVEAENHSNEPTEGFIPWLSGLAAVQEVSMGRLDDEIIFPPLEVEFNKLHLLKIFYFYYMLDCIMHLKINPYNSHKQVRVIIMLLLF